MDKFVIVCVFKFEKEFVVRIKYLDLMIVLVSDDYMIFLVDWYVIWVIELIMVIFFGIEFFYEFVCFDIKVLYFVVVIVCDKDVFLVFVEGYGYWVE